MNLMPGKKKTYCADGGNDYGENEYEVLEKGNCCIADNMYSLSAGFSKCGMCGKIKQYCEDAV